MNDNACGREKVDTCARLENDAGCAAYRIVQVEMMY